MKVTVITTLLIIALAAGIGAFYHFSAAKPAPLNIVANILPLAPDKASAVQNIHGLFEPVENFADRATKKQFGIYITPETSPVQDDRFTGYHTGVDAEYSDVVGGVPVHAIADGTIISATWSHGYGGVIVIRHIIDGIPTLALYGHLNTASFNKNIIAGVTQVKAGEIIAVLGDDHSQETDGVRKHLHFGLYRGDKIDIRGYVPTQDDLKPWLNPLEFF